MVIAEVERNTAPDSEAVPRPIRWTKAEYYRMGEAGLFEKRRVEMIDGEIIEMSPIGVRHLKGVIIATEALRNAFGAGFFLSTQGPFDAGEDDEPEPDIAVIAGDPRAVTAVPDSAALLVEVSDTTLRYDRGVKASLYARAGVDDYWIVNLNDNVVEVYRRRSEQPQQPFLFGYDEIRIYRPGENIVPLAAPQAAVPVQDLLP